MTRSREAGSAATIEPEGVLRDRVYGAIVDDALRIHEVAFVQIVEHEALTVDVDDENGVAGRPPRLAVRHVENVQDHDAQALRRPAEIAQRPVLGDRIIPAHPES